MKPVLRIYNFLFIYKTYVNVHYVRMRGMWNHSLCNDANERLKIPKERKCDIYAIIVI